MPRNECSECGGREFYAREVAATGGGHGPDLLPGTGSFFKHGKFKMHVCGRCGYVKWFVAQRFLDDIRERGKFHRVD